MSTSSFAQINVGRVGQERLLISFKKRSIANETDLVELDADLRLLSQQKKPKKFVIDCASLDFLGMVAFTSFGRLHRRLEERGAKLVLCRMPVHIDIICKFLKYDKYFTMTDELDLPAFTSSHLHAA